jgi:Zn-dependent protease with chaperone function
LKNILLCLILLGSAGVSSAATFKDAQGVYNHLIKANGFHLAPKLGLEMNPYPNARASFARITITSGMLKFVHNKDELALILGHELGHFTRIDLSSTPSHEFAADKLGAVYADVAGYNHCTGVAVLKRFNDRASKTHPDSDERYNRLKCAARAVDGHKK